MPQDKSRHVGMCAIRFTHTHVREHMDANMVSSGIFTITFPSPPRRRTYPRWNPLAPNEGATTITMAGDASGVGSR